MVRRCLTETLFTDNLVFGNVPNDVCILARDIDLLVILKRVYLYFVSHIRRAYGATECFSVPMKHRHGIYNFLSCATNYRSYAGR